MLKTITDDSFLKKLFNRKYKTNIVVRECDLERLPFAKKVEYVIYRISGFHFDKARLTIQYWDDINRITSIFKKYNICDYKIQRDYNGKSTPGLIDIYFEKGDFNNDFFRDILTKHYGYELAKNDMLSVCLFYAIETETEITLFHLYDDRGFREYSYVF